MSTADVFEDGFPHGTVAGYEKGCHSSGACPSKVETGQTCVKAMSRYRMDNAYRRLVDGGASIEVQALPETAVVSAPKQRKAAIEIPTPIPQSTEGDAGKNVLYSPPRPQLLGRALADLRAAEQDAQPTTAPEPLHTVPAAVEPTPNLPERTPTAGKATDETENTPVRTETTPKETPALAADAQETTVKAAPEHTPELEQTLAELREKHPPESTFPLHDRPRLPLTPIMAPAMAAYALQHAVANIDQSLGKLRETNGRLGLHPTPTSRHDEDGDLQGTDPTDELPALAAGIKLTDEQLLDLAPGDVVDVVLERLTDGSSKGVRGNVTRVPVAPGIIGVYVDGAFYDGTHDFYLVQQSSRLVAGFDAATDTVTFHRVHPDTTTAIAEPHTVSPTNDFDYDPADVDPWHHTTQTPTQEQRRSPDPATTFDAGRRRTMLQHLTFPLLRHIWLEGFNARVDE